MEAASVAWEPLGWKAVGFSEIEPFPCAILKHRFPNTPNYGSLTEYQQWPLGPDSIDLLVGGTPCQSFSVAGLRKGLADPRGNLALTFLGLADKLRPRWIVWENVPGVLSSGGGRDFGSFLGALEQLGYGWAYRVLDAQYFGVPQRRRRVFVVASLGGRDVAASVLLKPESLCWHPAKGRKKGQATAADAGSGVEAGLPRTVGTLCADAHPGAYSGQDAYTGRLIPSEQPVPFRKSKRACSTTDNETWVEADASNTLNNFDLGDTRTTHAVVEPIPIQDGREMEKKQNGMGVANEGDPAYTIDTTGAQAIAIQGTIIGRNDTRTTHAVVGAVYENHAQDSRITGPLEVAPTVAAKFGTGGGNTPLVSAMAVRRLTPTECERLQGFPDNWSRIPWKGKPEDQCPDGPRYKACGNSMAVPVMRWIGEQIARVQLSHNQPTNTNA